MTPALSPSDSARPKHRLRTTVIGAMFLVIAATTATGIVASSPAVGFAADSTLPPLLPGVAKLLNAASLDRPDRADAPDRPHATPCVHNQSGHQLIVVSVKQQHLWACTGPHVVFNSPVTTGAARLGRGTPHGTFAVEAAVPNTTLTTLEGTSVHVSYWVPFSQNLYGFHDAPWQTMPFGSNNYATQGSRGCVHVPTPVMSRLFHWVHYGAKVRIN